MKKLSLLIPCLILFVSGCSLFHSDNLLPDSLPNKFKDLSSYALSDFHLSDNYTYWEVRLSAGEVNGSAKTIFSFDSSAYRELSAGLQKEIKDVIPKGGWPRCFPGGCVAYGVAVLGHSVKLIPGDLDLLSFFGPIDTEAELHFYLWAKPYYTKLISYKTTSFGYYVMVEKTNSCFNRYDKDLISVSERGKIKILKTYSTRKTQGCV